MDLEVNYIGMDLGSFKTSATASNGKRCVIPTAVGWPRDHIARKRLGKDMVLGREIRDRRAIIDIVRPFEKGALKYSDVTANETDASVQRSKEAARLIVAHAVAMTDPRPDRPTYGVIGSPSRASIHNKQVILEAAQSAFDAVAIMPEPFAAAYGVELFDEALVVDIGAGTVDICPVFGRLPRDEEQVTIEIGGDAIDESCHQLIRHVYPEANLSREMAREIKERYGFVGESEEHVLVELPVDDKVRKFDVTEPLRQACETIVPTILEGVRTVLARVEPEYRSSLRRNILLSGGGSQLRGLDRAITDQLGMAGGETVVHRIYDSVFAGASGALKLAMEMPHDQWEHLKSLRQSLAAA